MGLLNDDKVQVQFRGDCFGQLIIFNMGYTVVGNFPVITSIAQDLEAIISDIDLGVLTTVRAAYLSCLAPQYTLRSTRAQKVNPIRSAFRESSLAFPGTNANPATVANDAAALTLRGDIAGPHFHGTKHVGPVPDGASANGLLTDAYRALVQILGTRMLETWVPTGSGSLLVQSIWASPVAASLFMTARSTGLQSRVQRRRTVGVGK